MHVFESTIKAGKRLKTANQYSKDTVLFDREWHKVTMCDPIVIWGIRVLSRTRRTVNRQQLKI